MRDEAVTGLRLTESHMPGTTLAAISIPCLGSWAHAMYDTPGIIKKEPSTRSRKLLDRFRRPKN